MWRRLVSPSLSAQLSAGAGLLRATLGLRVLLGGALATGVIMLVLHPHGLALVGLRVTLAVPVVLLFLARTGELMVLWCDVQRLRALLGSALPWHGSVSRQRRLLMTSLCVVLRVSHRPCAESTASEDPAHGDGHPVNPGSHAAAPAGCTTRGRAGKRPWPSCSS